MLSLFRKFPFDTVTVDRPRKLEFAGGAVYLNKAKELHYERGSGSVVVAYDVYAYSVDEKGLWFIKNEDMKQGRDVVYRKEDGIFEPVRGILDSGLQFFYVQDGELYLETEEGETVKVCACSDLKQLSYLTEDDVGLGISQLEDLLNVEYGCYRYTKGAFFEDLCSLHKLLSDFAKEKNEESERSEASAKIIIKLLEMCSELNMDVTGPMKELVAEIVEAKKVPEEE